MALDPQVLHLGHCLDNYLALLDTDLKSQNLLVVYSVFIVRKFILF